MLNQNKGRILSLLLCFVLSVNTLTAFAENSGTDEPNIVQSAENPEQEPEKEQTEKKQQEETKDNIEGKKAASSAAAAEIMKEDGDAQTDGEEDQEEVTDDDDVSALVPESLLNQEEEVQYGENVERAKEDRQESEYADNYALRMMPVASNSYKVSKAGTTTGSFTDVSSHSSFSAAKSAMDAKAKSDSSNADAYVVRYNNRVVAMKKGMAIITSSKATLSLGNTYGGRNPYITNKYTAYYNGTDSLSKVNIAISGVTGYTGYQNLLLIPKPFMKGYAKSGNTYERDYYTKNSNGALVHTVTTFSDKNSSTHYESGEKTVQSSFVVDKAPGFMSSGTKYYSMDGANFYTDQFLSKKAGTHYPYYKYLSYHTQTSYSAADLNKYIANHSTAKNGVMKNQGSAFISAQSSYGINPVLELAFASLESGYGTSNYAKNRNNLFGINAGDANPNDASYYSSVKKCIAYHAGTLLKQGYFDALTDGRYFGTNAGGKTTGVNVAYASDPFHGEKIAGIAYSIDKYLGSKDYGKYTIGISGKSTPVYTATSGSTELYKLRNNKSKSDLTGLPVVVIGTNSGRYKVQSDMPIVSGKANCKGTYSYSHVGYSNTGAITQVNKGSGGGTTVTVGTPSGLKAAAASETSVKVSWSSAGNASGYELWYSTSKDGTYTKVKSLTGTSHTHTGLKKATTYYYKVRAYLTADGKTTYSSYTSTVSFKIQPGQVAGAKISQTANTTNQISWTKLSGVTGYQIYRSTKKSSGYSKIKTITSDGTVSYKDTKLKIGTTYYYKVRAYRKVNGNNIYGSYSGILSRKVVPLKVSGVKAAVASNTSAKISWKKQTSISGYEVYRSTKKASGYKKVKTVTKASTVSYKNTKLKASTIYYYKVRAYKTVSGKKVYGAYSSVVSFQAKPGTPGGVKTQKYSKNAIKVTWNKVSGASGYEVYRYNSKTGKCVRTFYVPESRRYIINTELPMNKTHYYKVRAYKTVSGKRVYSNYSSIVSRKL